MHTSNRSNKDENIPTDGQREYETILNSHLFQEKLYPRDSLIEIQCFIYYTGVLQSHLFNINKMNQ